MLKKPVILGIILLFLIISIFPMVTSISSSYNNIIYEDNGRGAYYTKIHYKIENGSLSGFVNDSFFNPIERALVSIKCGGLHMQNFSDSTGFYYIDNVPIVDCYWNVSASKKGYETFWVEMSIDINSTYDFVLTPLGKTLYVGGSGPENYTTIQSAIDDANNGDTVFVYSGIYYENNIFINQSITLIGEDRNTTIIDAKQEINAICLYTQNININGFNIRNTSRAGINFQSNTSHYINISNNIFSNNSHGIHPYFPNKHTIVSNNIFIDNYNGFTLVSCSNATIYQNIFINNYRSIGIYGSENCDIFLNNILYSKKCGIYLYGFSRYNYIHNNNFMKDNNNIDAYFVQFSHINKWDENYWNEPKIMPYPIIGSLGWGIPCWINFDWHPAQEPYDI